MDQVFSDLSEVSQQDLRVLLDHAPDAIARFDRHLRHVYVNEATARENNRPATDFYQKTMEDLGHSPEVCELINSNLRAVFASGEERTFEILFRGPFGERWFQCRMAPELNGASVEYVLVMSRDITDQKRAESAIRTADLQAQGIKLTAKLAHEINNPLTVLVNSVFLLQMNSSLDEQAREFLRMAADAVARISSLSKQILSLNPGDSEETAA